MGKFMLTQRANGEFQFNLLAANNQVILSSQGYNAKASCINGINSVKANATHDQLYERLNSQDGKYYFNLLSTNRQVIGTSQMYGAAASMENGIASVKSNAPDAETIDETAK